MESKSEINLSQLAGLINPSSFANKINVSNSLADPRDIYKNCKSSLSDLLAEPSAMFAGMETLALRICEVSPNFSSTGKEAVCEYIILTKSKLSFQASSFWCGFIYNWFNVTNKNMNFWPAFQSIPNFQLPTRSF